MSGRLTIQFVFQGPVILDVQIPMEWLLYLVIFFAGAIVCLLAYIGFYIIRELRRKAKYRHLIKIYSNFIGDIIISESEDDLEKVLQQPYVQTILRRWMIIPMGRKVLIEQLVQNHKSLTGQAGNNLVWLYTTLRLYEDSLADLSSAEWHIKAAAMQQLAEMQQKDSLKRLYRETNSSIYIVRAEAQVAVVKLSGFEGLRFLNVISQPVTQWQQLCLLNQLTAPNESQAMNIYSWLDSSNDTIVEFALRLISKFQLLNFHDAVAVCLKHPSSIVRCQAINTLRDVANESTPDVLTQDFQQMDRKEQLRILLLLAEFGTENQLSFLRTISQESTGIHKKTAERSAAIIIKSSEYNSTGDDSAGSEVKAVIA